MRIEPLPDYLFDMAARLHECGWFDRPPDQVIVNESVENQGISPHVDRDCLGPSLATISLGDAWPMQLADPSRREKIEPLLEVGSLLVLQGLSRTLWTHGIAGRKTDPRGGVRRTRQRRVSVTFRTVLRAA